MDTQPKAFTIETPISDVDVDGVVYKMVQIPENFFDLINVKDGDILVWRIEGENINIEIKR